MSQLELGMYTGVCYDSEKTIRQGNTIELWLNQDYSKDNTKSNGDVISVLVKDIKLLEATKDFPKKEMHIEMENEDE